MSRLLIIALPIVVLMGCSDSTGVNGGGGGGGGGNGSLTAVAPAPSAISVPTTTTITLHFGQAMMAGMEQYMDLHQGSLDQPTVPMACGWNQDLTVLTCTPDQPLMPGTHYLIHVGAGMKDAGGHMVDMGDWPAMGGHWATTTGMMGGTHAGEPMSMMGAGWKDASGHYGMMFEFTTA